MAGVSVGTVDRVLHKRGRVSEDSQKKVETALKNIDYQPNLIARSLASKKVCRLLAIIPSFQSGDYWSIVYSGITKAAREFANYHFEIQPFFFNQYDHSSFDLALKEIQKETYQGVIIATLFKESSLELAHKLDKQSIPYILIDAYIENTNCIAYYGTDSYASGFLGGRLLFKQIQPDDNIILFNIIQKRNCESPQVSMRKKGFHDYLSKAGYTGKIYPAPISAESPEKNKSALSALSKNRQKIKAGIIFNSRVHLAAEYFLKQKTDDFFLIGYDTTEANIPYLKNETVSHLIAQRPEVQGYNSVKTLFYHLSLHQPVKKINYMPIDILVKENIDYYNNYI